MILYKYRSLDNFKNFIDIVLNNRIYASKYFELNDPMEGLYIYNEGTINEDMVREIKSEKSQLKICSFSQTPKSTLMWSHYANGHKGVVIGVKVKPNHEVHTVNYGGLSLVKHAHQNGSHETAKSILTHKLEAWDYEEEKRIFVENGNYADVKIEKIILGSRITSVDKKLVKGIVAKINPEIVITESDVEKIV